MTHSTHLILLLYGLGHMVKDDSTYVGYMLTFQISSKESFIRTIPQTGLCYTSRRALAGTVEREI